MPEMMSPTGAPIGTFVKFHEFSSLVEKKDQKPTVYGIATWEKPDSDDEICDYESAVPVYQSWSKKAAQRTKGAGQELSLGNIRLMHGAEVGGKVTSIDFRDDAKEIAVGSEPVDDAVYQQLKGGYLTGYSQGGSYAWRECDICKTAMSLQQGMNFCAECGKLVPVRYGLKRLAEISYVDSPAIGEGFEHVKAGGSRSIIKFQKHKQQEGIVAKTKTVAGEALEASAFAFVGDASKTSTWKFPVKFADAEKSKRHIRKALALIGKSPIPAESMATAKAAIVAAVSATGMDLEAEDAAIEKKRAEILEQLHGQIDKAAEAKGCRKGLYAVGRFADILESLAYLYESSVYEREIEGDDSEVPDELKEQLQGLIETFIAMAEEEARELAANKNKKGAISQMEKTAEQLALEKAAKKSLASHFAKAASHHEKMATVHEAIAAEHDAASDHHEKAMGACKDSMGKATKADVGSDDAAQPVHEVLATQVEFHKAMAGCEAKKADQHEKLAGFHGKMADHYTKMAEANDESADKADTASLLKGFREEADPAPKQRTTPAAAVTAATTPSMDEDVAKAAAAMRETPEYKESISAIAKAQVEAEVEALRKKTLAPTGVSIIDPNHSKAAAPGSVAAVQRGGEAEPFEFATAAGKTSTGGL